MDIDVLIKDAERVLQDSFLEIDTICFKNSEKVLNAFHECQVMESDFQTTTGYGYHDIGRDKVESVFASIFKAEDALVRTQFISGTHALTVCLFGLLRPGDTLLSITGKPYDTLDEVIGIRENSSSLKAFGVSYEEIDLIESDFDYDAIAKRIKDKKIKVVEIQRSRGYSTRKTISIEQVEKVIAVMKQVDPEIIVMIDNCYCEFVCEKEPIEVGADIVVGSLIKNLGGGIASNGAYIVGRRDLIDLVSQRLTVPGCGKEVGPSLGFNKLFLQGVFFAPSVVASALKTALLASYLLEKMGYVTDPRFDEFRSDIVQTISFFDEKPLIAFCRGIQAGSPIDSNVVPYPSGMPGYDAKVIMAAGAFTQGSSIELSCDAPLREPYMAYLQGGLTYEYGKLGIRRAIEEIIGKVE